MLYEARNVNFAKCIRAVSSLLLLARARTRCGMRQKIMKAIFQFGSILSPPLPLFLSNGNGGSSLSLTSTDVMRGTLIWTAVISLSFPAG